jgi:hypothetical protein
MAAEVSTAPIAAEAVQRSDAVLEIEREIIGQSRNQPLAIRGVRSIQSRCLDASAMGARFNQGRHGQGARLQSQGLTRNR